MHTSTCTHTPLMHIHTSTHSHAHVHSGVLQHAMSGQEPCVLVQYLISLSHSISLALEKIRVVGREKPVGARLCVYVCCAVLCEWLSAHVKENIYLFSLSLSLSLSLAPSPFSVSVSCSVSLSLCLSLQLKHACWCIGPLVSPWALDFASLAWNLWRGCNTTVVFGGICYIKHGM